MTVALTLLANTAPPGQPEVESDATAPYVFLAPGVGAMALEDPAFDSDVTSTEASRFAYQWGVRGGVLRRFPRHLAMGFGGHLEHSFSKSTTTIHGIDPEDRIYHSTKNLLRVQVEYLPGLLVANERLFIHAIVGFGYMGEYHYREIYADPVLGGDPRFEYHGLAVSPGLGLLGRVWRGLSLGIHVGADLGWTNEDGDFVAKHSFDLATEIGWVF